MIGADDLRAVSVEFLRAGASSLDYEVELDLTGAAAPRFEEIERELARIVAKYKDRQADMGKGRGKGRTFNPMAMLREGLKSALKGLPVSGRSRTADGIPPGSNPAADLFGPDYKSKIQADAARQYAEHQKWIRSVEETIWDVREADYTDFPKA